jgi:hypothetical protein
MTVLATFVLDEPANLVGFAPATRSGASGELGLYIATELLAGRQLFTVLGDTFVQDRLDFHPWLLDELGCDPVLRGLFGGGLVEDAVLAARLAA